MNTFIIEKLSKTLQDQECLQYAGFCCLAKARYSLCDILFTWIIDHDFNAEVIPFRCENTLANSTGEVEALTQAGKEHFSRLSIIYNISIVSHTVIHHYYIHSLFLLARLFLHAEQDSLHLKCPMFQEHLTEAIHCFNQAIKVLKLLHMAQQNLIPNSMVSQHFYLLFSYTVTMATWILQLVYVWSWETPLV